MDRRKDGLTVEQYQAGLDAAFAAAYKVVETGFSVRRKNRLVVALTDLTFDRLALAAARQEAFGEWEKATKSGLANYLISEGLAKLESELLKEEV